MRRRSGIGRRAAALLLSGLAILGAGQGAFAPTAAAWSDSVQASASISAGRWAVPAETGCTAYGFQGERIDGCTLGEARFEGWGEPGHRTRNYYLTFSVPDGTRSVSFDVDLTTAVGPQETDWSWGTAGVAAGAQFSAIDGWSCEGLPRVQGRGSDWQVPTIYFQVVENREDAQILCS